MKRRALGSLLVGAMVVVCFVGPGSALYQPSSSVTTSSIADEDVVHQYAEDTARKTIRIAVRPNGSGVVTVRYRIALTDANETTAFERLRANITANASWYRTRFGARMNRVVASAQAATGRNMRVTNLTVNTTRRGATGIVTYSFVWTRFAVTEGNRIRVGDALEGFYLANGTRLTIAWPAGYEPTAVLPPPDERRTNSIAWSAPTTFGENEPFVELAPAGSTMNVRNPSNTSNVSGGADERSNTAARGGSNVGAEGVSDIGPLLTVAAVGVVLGALVLVVWLGRRDDGGQSKTDEPTAANTGTDDTELSEPTAADASQAELLSNRERVVRVLERAGGRAKQQHVVEELGWTEAKTSQVVSDLREEGTITGFRLGRENVLAIPEANTEDDENSAE